MPLIKQQFNEQYWLGVMSGREKGFRATAFRGGLLLLSSLYRLGAGFKNWLFDFGLRRPKSIGVPVISVGNLTTGGTGKTPAVAWFVEHFQKQGLRPGIISRGYRALEDDENDEKKLLDSLCPDVPHLQDRDRIAAGRKMLEQTNANILILDDAFQHRRIHRDCDVVLIDALNPWGYGNLLPRGLLRETKKGLQRASVIFITRSNLVSASELEKLRAEASSYTAAPVFLTVFEVTGLVNASGVKRPFDALLNKSLLLFCGVGNPQGVLETVESELRELKQQHSQIRLKSFPDHHHYTEEDTRNLQQIAGEISADLFLTTRKDLVKFPRDELNGLEVWAIDIEMRVLADDSEYRELLNYG